MNAPNLAEKLTLRASFMGLWAPPVLAVKHVRNTARQALPRQYDAEFGHQWSATTKEPSKKSNFSRSAD
jgi:hypothetical protein